MLSSLSIVFTILFVYTNVFASAFSIGIGVNLENTTDVAINASGLVPVLGYNVSQPFPSNLTDGWSFGLDVAADVPASVSEEGNTGFATLSYLYMNRPESTIDDSWRICAAWLGRVDVSGGDDGSCSSALGQDCIDALSTQLSSANERFGRCSVPPISMPEECGDRIDSDIMASTSKHMSPGSRSNPVVTNRAIPIDVTFNDTEDREEFAVVEEDGPSSIHQQGNYSAYDGTAKKAHVLALSFMSTDTNETAGTIGFACVKANITAEGSRVPSSASTPSSTTALSLTIGLFLAFGVLNLV